MSTGILVQGLGELGLLDGPILQNFEQSWDKEALLKQLELFRRELEFWNPKYGLVNSEGDETLVRHFLDSAAGVPLIAELNPRSLADIGSGAGFPGVIIALFLPLTQVTLVERSGKKCRFLENLQLRLNLKNLRVYEGGVENLNEKFEVLTTRGFSALDAKLEKQLSPRLTLQGNLVSYKGRREVIEKELQNWDSSKWENKVHSLKVPFLQEERHLVVSHRL